MKIMICRDRFFGYTNLGSRDSQSNVKSSILKNEKAEKEKWESFWLRSNLIIILRFEKENSMFKRKKK